MIQRFWVLSQWSLYEQVQALLAVRFCKGVWKKCGDTYVWSLDSERGRGTSK